MRKLLAFSEYTLQLAITFAIAVVALAKKGIHNMPAQRRFRNRRRPDPMNTTDRPRGCWNQGSFPIPDGANYLYLRANANVIVRGIPASYTNLGGPAITAIDQIDARNVRLTLNAPLASDLVFTYGADPNIDFGPNLVVDADSSVGISVAV
jgi:hypothetical protein